MLLTRLQLRLQAVGGSLLQAGASSGLMATVSRPGECECLTWALLNIVDALMVGVAAKWHSKTLLASLCKQPLEASAGLVQSLVRAAEVILAGVSRLDIIFENAPLSIPALESMPSA